MISTAQYIFNQTVDSVYDARFDSKLNWWEDIIIAVYLICITAVILNLIVIYTFARNWSTLITSDYYILNLACSDVLLPLTGFSLPITSSFFHRWIFGEIGCAIYGFMGFFFGLVSITTLAVMGITRYISICHPQFDVSSNRFTRNAVIFPYIYALTWAAIPLCGWGSYSAESYGTSCTLQWDNNRVYITLVALFCILAPSLIMFFAYGLILLKCRKSARTINGFGPRQSKHIMSRKEVYLIKITFSMWWGFIISWMPYAVVSMWSAYSDSRILPTRLVTVAVLLAKSSTIVNPIIYFMCNKKFRPMFLKSISWYCLTCSLFRSITIQEGVQ